MAKKRAKRKPENSASQSEVPPALGDSVARQVASDTTPPPKLAPTAVPFRHEPPPLAADPAVDVAPEPEIPAVDEPEAKLPTLATLEVPIGDLDEGYLSRHVDVRLSTREQRESLRCVKNGLRQAGEKLDSGHPVRSYSDTVKWLLEQCASCK